MSKIYQKPEGLAEYIYQIRTHGGRVTNAKKLLIEMLAAAESHLTAENIYDSLIGAIPKLNLSTIYRILEELESFGIITHTHFGHGPATYEIKAIGHIHLICQRCGASGSVPQNLFKSIADKLQKQYGFKIDLSHFAIPGLCKNCQNTSAAD